MDKANTKAKFRKAIANAEMGYTENAITQLEALLKEDPASMYLILHCNPSLPAEFSFIQSVDAPSINTELAKIRVKDKERQKAADKKLKGEISSS